MLEYQKKTKTPEPESSSEEEVCLDETALCDDSSDEYSDDEYSDNESHVQTSLSLDNTDIDDHILVKFESERATQYYVGRVLEPAHLLEPAYYLLLAPCHRCSPLHRKGPTLCHKPHHSNTTGRD